MNRHWTSRDGSISILLAFLAAILLIATAPSIGLTLDEPAYIGGADSYGSWLSMLGKDPGRALKSQTIDSYWSINHEHPPVEKIWSGVIWLAARHFFDELTANRLGPILMTAVLVALLYLIIARKYGSGPGLFAVAALMSMPRFFFHSHLAALDVPVAVGVFAMTFIFWETVDRKGWAWGILWGVVWGLVVAIKLNGVFIPIALVIWLLAFRRSATMMLRLFIMGIVAMVTFVLVWPWLYFHTWTRLLEYVNFHVDHYGIGQWYLGHLYMPPPWHYAFVILWAVIPLTAMLMILVGITRAGNGTKDKGLTWLLILSCVGSILPFLFGKTYLYNGERLFMPVFPFLAALAGIGFGRLQGWLKGWAGRHVPIYLTTPLTVTLALVLLAPQVWTMTRLYPHLLCYYSEGVGGLPGATKLGLETTYWGEIDSAALPYINAHADTGTLIWSEDKDMLLFYQSIGLLRQDLKFMDLPSSGDARYQQATEDIKRANWFIFSYWQSKFGSGGVGSYLPWTLLKNQVPVYEVSFEGVPLLKLYGPFK